MVRAKPADIDVLLRVYYENPELGSAEIRQLYPTAGAHTIDKLKKIALQEMAERKVKSFRMYTVNTEIAYEAWGLDVASLERRQAKLKKLGLVG